MLGLPEEGGVPVSEPEKPPDCTCSYPQTLYRSPTGHSASCPIQRRHEDEAWKKIREKLKQRQAKRRS